jgi:hypothetical protein
MAGATRSFGAGETDAWVLKLRADGSIEWQMSYGGVANDWAYSIQQTTDGGYIVAGMTYSFSAGKRNNLWALKLNDKGLVAPSCDFIRNSPLSGKDYNVIVKTSSVTGKDSWAGSRDSTATVQATNAPARLLCP